MPSERVQKILAQAGIASRRKAEDLIRDGFVTINGRAAKLGDKADLKTDAIKVNGKLLRPVDVESHEYIVFHKPRGVISMIEDPQGRPAIGGYLGRIQSRLYPAGRLDFLSEGLIILTNDGDVAQKLQKDTTIPRIYEVKIKGVISDEMLDRIRRGGTIEGRKIKPYSVEMKQELNKKTKLKIVVLGAGTGDLRGLLVDRGFLVDKIVRTGLGHLRIDGIKPGEFKKLRDTQIQSIFAQPELSERLLKEEAEQKKSRMVPATKGQLGIRGRGPRTGDDRSERPSSRTPVPVGRGEKKVISPRGSGPAKSSWGADRGNDRPQRSGERAPRAVRSGPRATGGEDRAGSRAPRSGFGASRGPRSSEGFGASRGPRSSEGFGASRGPRSSEGFGASRGPRSSEGFGASRGPRSSSGFGASRGPRSSEGFGAKRPSPAGSGGFSRGPRSSGAPKGRGKPPRRPGS